MTKTMEPWELLEEQVVEGLGARRIEALPRSLHQARPLITTIDPLLRETEDWEGGRRRTAEVVQLVSGLGDSERTALFSALFPRLEKAMEAAWQNQARRPLHLEDYEEFSRPFRAPSNEALLRISRAKWFVQVVDALVQYDPNPRWLAEWISHLAYRTDLSWLMAAILDEGGPESDECLEILKASASGQHSIGEPSTVVTSALLVSEREEAWSFVERMLMAAKRDEGLRQSILEVVHEAHPEAFRRMLKLILDENLVRFSSVVRAADVWFGLRWDSMSAKLIQDQMRLALKFLGDEKARDGAIEGKDGGVAYLGLWATAFEDLDAVEERAGALLAQGAVEKRFAAVHLLAQTGMPHLAGLMSRALGDEDLRVTARATDYFKLVDLKGDARRTAFEGLASLFERVAAGKTAKLNEIIWPWTARTLSTRDIGAALSTLADASTAERLVEHIDKFETYDRERIARYLGRMQADDFRDDCEEAVGAARGGEHAGELEPISEGARVALVGLLGDGAKIVREAAFDGLSGRPVQADEAARIESLLDRKASDLRTRGLARLAQQTDDGAMASAARLLGDRRGERRRAGAELLLVLARAQRCASEIAELVRNLDLDALGSATRQQLERLEQAARPGTTLKACLGLAEAVTIPPAAPPVDRGFPKVTAAALRMILDLDRLVDEHKMATVPARPGSGEIETTLGAASSWQLRPEEADRDGGAQQRRRTGEVVLADLWRRWYRERSEELRDSDGMELLRALLAMESRVYTSWNKPKRWPSGLEGILKEGELGKVTYDEQVEVVLEWLLRTEGPPGWERVLLDAMETAIVSGEIEETKGEDDDAELRQPEIIHSFDWYTRRLNDLSRYWLSDADEVRLWGLYRAIDDWGARTWSPRRLEYLAKPKPKSTHSWDEPREYIPRANVRTIFAAMRAGLITETYLIYHMLHAHPGEAWCDRDFNVLTNPKRLAEHNPPAGVSDVVQRVVARIVDLELERGDAETETTGPASSIAHPGGMNVALRALWRLGQLNLARHGHRWNDDKANVLSGFVMRSEPLEGETPKAFAKALAQYDLPEDRLVQLAVYAPQWAAHVEEALGLSGLGEGVWWIHAHTKDSEWRLDDHVQEIRDASIAERTALSAPELKDGAVDVAWFGRVYKQLGKACWERLYEAAKYACGGIGHKRAQLFADAMLGKIVERDLVKRIETKRHQDSIRALGLLPLKGKNGQVLARYRVMQEVRRTSRKHGGSMLQASEKRAVEIGMENLARTAGYPDPVRLQWAMEQVAVADLAKGPVAVSVGKAGAKDRVSVTLSIDDTGAPQVDVIKGEKRLASIPPAIKKDKPVAELTERVKQIRQQTSRMRQSLEQAMCRGDVFSGKELAELFMHPVLRPMLERLVFVGAAASGKALMGCPDKGGRALRSHGGALEPLKGTDQLQIAHPHDLFKSKAWSKWQRECFETERVQPFKQVFRELYVLTEQERTEKVRSTRYAGHQVQPRQALALLGQRGWVSRPEEGVLRTFHAEQLTAWVEFDEPFFTPAEVEGLTLEAVRFNRAGKDEPVKLADVPARIFSEVMRDMDLVVSVAHRGGVDPEASESTVEMRASLLRETCRLLKLSNVKIEGSRVNILGQLGDYSVHLGSATVQMMPGGSLWIVPVHAQHRGRIFLPFADQDPKSAEVISKVLLLARDSEIKDPAIRERMREMAR